MGYPMTYQRLINRNRLYDGDYQKPPMDWAASSAAAATIDLSNDQLIHVVEFWKRHINEEVASWSNKVALLVGDLRRLERDTVDERAIATYIAQRTGIDVDTVAAVLKEFIAW